MRIWRNAAIVCWLLPQQLEHTGERQPYSLLRFGAVNAAAACRGDEAVVALLIWRRFCGRL